MADVPTKKDVDSLPRWAKVAFAARCARRVLPLYWLPAETPEIALHLRKAMRSIEFAEFCAADGLPADVRTEADLPEGLNASGRSAKFALAAAAVAADAEVNEPAYLAFEAAHEAAWEWSDDAYENGDGYAVENSWLFDDAVRADFDLLRRRASEEEWDDMTAIPLEILGALWPGRVPSWVEEADAWQQEVLSPNGEPQADELSPQPRQLEISLDLGDASLLDREVVERVREIVLAANALHRAQGGKGLKIDDLQILTESPILEGVPRG